jgi:predicted neuraminidase
MMLIGAIVLSEFIFQDAPFPSCHASTIVETRDGTLLAAWFGGSREGSTDVEVYLSHKRDRSWSPPVPIARGAEGESCYNPVLFQPNHGPLMLFYKAGTAPSRWHGMMSSSVDNGRTWSIPTRLPKGIFGPIKNKPIELADGTILCGSSDEAHGWTLHFEWTNDLGKTWHRTEPLEGEASTDAIQPALMERPGGRILAVARTRRHRVCYAESDDNGKRWSPLSLMDVPNPNSGLDAIALADGRLLMVNNDSERHRTPLTVDLSTDGRNWSKALTLENGPGEFSYPALIQTRDGLIHITYTWNRVRIRHVVIDPKELSIEDW